MDTQQQLQTYLPKPYRRNIITFCFIIFLCGLFLSVFILYLMSRQSIGPSYGEGYRMLSQLRHDIILKSCLVFSVTILLSMAAIIRLTLRYSHRVAGPGYRLTVFMNTAKKGDLSSKVFLRSSDVLHPLAEDINGMILRYQQKAAALQSHINNLHSAADHLRQEKISLDWVHAMIEHETNAIISLTGK